MDIRINQNSKDITMKGIQKKDNTATTNKSSEEKDISQGIKAEDAIGRASLAIISKSDRFSPEPATDKEAQEKMKKLLNKLDLDLGKNERDILENMTTKEIYPFAEKICLDKNFKKNERCNIIMGLRNNNRDISRTYVNLAKYLYTNKNFDNEYIWDMIMSVYSNINNPEFIQEKADFVQELVSDDIIPTKDIDNILYKLSDKKDDNLDFAKEQLDFVKNLYHDELFPNNLIKSTLDKTITNNIEYSKIKLNLANDLLKDNDFPNHKITDVLSFIYDDKNINDRANITRKMLKDKTFDNQLIAPTLMSFGAFDDEIESKKIQLANKLLDIKDFPKEDIKYSMPICFNKEIAEKQFDFIDELLNNDKIPYKTISSFVLSINESDANIAEFKISFAKELLNNDNIDITKIPQIVNYTKECDRDFIVDLCNSTEFPIEEVKHIAANLNGSNKTFAYELCHNKDFPKEYIAEIISYIKPDSPEYLELAKELCNNKDFPKEDISTVFEINKFSEYFQSEKLKELPIDKKLFLYENLTKLSGTSKQYCLKEQNINVDNLIEKIKKQLGKKRGIISTPDKLQKAFLNNVLANNNDIAENAFKEFDFTKYGKKGLPLKYSREEFNKNLTKLISQIPETDKDTVLKHFGIEEGYDGFDGLLNNQPLKDENVLAPTKAVAQKIQNEINNFTIKNEVNINNPIIKEYLDGLIKGFPEFTTFIGKQQHETHAYSLDIHTLKVLQSAMNDKKYETLSDKDKTVLKLAILCHDFGKKGGIIDEGHASLSADYAYSILDKFNIPQEIKDRTIEVIENHHWFASYNQNNISAEDVAVRCRKPGDFPIYEIFSKADFENVNPNFHFYITSTNTEEEFNNFFDEKMIRINSVLNKIYSNANLIFDTQYTNNGTKFPEEKINLNGNEYKINVLDFNKIDKKEDLLKYGFEPGITKESARFTVHMTDPDLHSMETVSILMDNPIHQSTWSTSLIKPEHNTTYCGKKFGFILETNQANISEAYNENTSSGCHKDLNNYKNIIFNNYNDSRTFVKNEFIKELNKKGIELNDSEYAILSKQLMNKKYLSQIKEDYKIGYKTIKSEDLKECLATSRDKLLTGIAHSEIVSINPKIKGLIAKVYNINDCPPQFIEFAHKHNLPIILMPPTD